MMNESHRDIDLSLANLTESAISANRFLAGIRFIDLRAVFPILPAE